MSTLRRTLLTLAGLLLLAGAAFAQQGGDGEVVEVRMVTEGSEYFNDPVGLHVLPGTTIRFLNESDMHTATTYCEEFGKERRIPEGAECWDSGMLAPGESFEVTLTVEGVYDYYCLPHEALGMVGRIIVGDPEASPAKDESTLFPVAQQVMPSVEEILEAEDGIVPWTGLQ